MQCGGLERGQEVEHGEREGDGHVDQRVTALDMGRQETG